MRTASLAMLLLASFAASGQDIDRGRLLYETYCGECHYPRVHERSPEKSRVRSLADLRDIVTERAPQTKFRFSLDDREAVVQYLNRSHYKLAK
jgi:mono/diheme cytochrome c family protein